LRVLSGSKPVGEFGELYAGFCSLAFGPLVSVDPDLDRVREVREEGRSHNNSPVTVLMPLIFSANTIGNTTLLPRRGKLPLAVMRRMTAKKARWLTR
jgi:hypothetical protein